jgi:hypothetical protein
MSKVREKVRVREMDSDRLNKEYIIGKTETRCLHVNTVRYNSLMMDAVH